MLLLLNSLGSGHVVGHGEAIDLDTIGFDEGVPEQDKHDEFQDQGNGQMPPEFASRGSGTPVGLVTSLHLSPAYSCDAYWEIRLSGLVSTRGSDKMTRDNLSLVIPCGAEYISIVFFRQKARFFSSPGFRGFFSGTSFW